MPKSVNTGSCPANAFITNSLKMFERLKIAKIFCVRGKIMELILKTVTAPKGHRVTTTGLVYNNAKNFDIVLS